MMTVNLIFRVFAGFFFAFNNAYYRFLSRPYPVVHNASWADGTSSVDLEISLLIVLGLLFFAYLTPPSSSPKVGFDHFTIAMEYACVGSAGLFYREFQNVSPTTRRALSVCLMVSGNVYMGWRLSGTNSSGAGGDHTTTTTTAVDSGFLKLRILNCFAFALYYTFCVLLDGPYPVVPDNSSWADGTSSVVLAINLLPVLCFLFFAYITPPSWSSDVDVVLDRYVVSIEGACLGLAGLFYNCFRNVSPITRQVLSGVVLVGGHVYMWWRLASTNASGGVRNEEKRGLVQNSSRESGATAGTTGGVVCG